jgi:hypothetical protein
LTNPTQHVRERARPKPQATRDGPSLRAGHFSNALTLWLGIKPAPLFFFLFLPPLLVDSASRIDYFIFKRVSSLPRLGLRGGSQGCRNRSSSRRPPPPRAPRPSGTFHDTAQSPSHPPHPRPQIAVAVLVFAFANVIIASFALIPFLQHVLGLAAEGWRPMDCALLAAMLSATDAVAVSAIIKAGAPPAAAPGAGGGPLEPEALPVLHGMAMRCLGWPSCGPALPVFGVPCV